MSKPSTCQENGLNGERGVRHSRKTVKLESHLQWSMARAVYFCCYTFTSSNSSPNINTLITPMMIKEAYRHWHSHLIRIQKCSGDCEHHTRNVKCYIKYHRAYASASAWFYVQIISSCVTISLWWRAPKPFHISDHISEQTLWCLLLFGCFKCRGKSGAG